MRSPKKPSRLVALALAAVALTAASATSADIHNGASGTYSGPVHGVNTGPDPTFDSDGITITCTTATIDGTIDGDWNTTGPATAVLSFAWSGCTSDGGLISCTVGPMEDVPFVISEENAPDGTFANTADAKTHIECGPGGSRHNCDWTWEPTTSPVTIDADSDTEVWTVNDTGDLSRVGCPDTGRWVAQYVITGPNGEPLDLFATGSQ